MTDKWFQTFTVDFVNQLPVYTPAGFVNLDGAKSIDVEEINNQQGAPLGKWRVEVVLAGASNPTQLLGVFDSEDEARAVARLLVGGQTLSTDWTV